MSQILHIPKVGQRAKLDHPILEGCIGWWPLNNRGGNIAKDLVGTYNGELLGQTTWVDSKRGTAVNFIGADNNQAITISQNDGTTPHYPEHVTVCGWARVSGVKDFARIFTTRTSLNRNGYYLTQTNNLGQGVFSVGIGTSSTTFTSANSPDNTVEYNKWFFIAGTYDKNYLRLFVNGLLSNEVVETSSIFYEPACQCVIGSEKRATLAGYQAEFLGDLSNIRLWDRALDDNEIMQLYQDPWIGLEKVSNTTYFLPTTTPEPPTTPSDNVVIIKPKRRPNSQVLHTPRIGQKAKLDHPILKDCICWYPINESAGNIANNLISQNNNGNIIGSMEWINTSRGVAITSDGTIGNTISLKQGSLSFVDGSNDLPFSISAWIRLSSGATVGGPVISKYSKVFPFAGQWTFSVNDTTQFFQCVDDNPTNRVRQDANSGFSIGQWYFITATYNANGTDEGISLYRNGIIDPSTGFGQDASYVSMTAYNITPDIGSAIKDDGAYQSYFNGSIQNVRIWNRVLSDNEIMQLYLDPWVGLEEPSTISYFSNIQVPQLIRNKFSFNKKLSIYGNGKFTLRV